MGHLSDRFTCYLPSLRGRGLSSDHPDLSVSRLREDFTAYIDSVEEPVGLVGWSLGAGLAVGIAQMRPGAVAAVAPFEPVFPRLLDDAEMAVLVAALTRCAALAGEGDLLAAARAFLTWPFDEGELDAADAAGYLEAASRYVPAMLIMLQQAMAGGPDPSEEPAALGAIEAPVLVMQGADTRPFFSTCAQYAIEHIPNARLHEFPEAGHAAPLTHPDALAGLLTEFFSTAQQPA